MLPEEQLPIKNTELSSLLSKNLPLHAILEQEVKKLQYGQISVNVVVKDGIAQMDTFNLVANKRVRY